MNSGSLSLQDIERQAKSLIPHNVWDFIEGGSQDMITTHRNIEQFNDIKLRPRPFLQTNERKLSTTILGHSISMPILLGAAGGHTFVHPNGELDTAQAAKDMNTGLALSTSSDYSLQEVAEIGAHPRIFQLYHCGRALTELLVKQAEDSGYAAIMLTVDCPVPSPMEGDLRNQFHKYGGATLGNFKSTKIRGLLPPDTKMVDMWERPPNIPLEFTELEWLKRLTTLPLIVKGIRTAEDATLCLENGVDGLLISNHGGRQIDTTLASIETLPEISIAAQGKMELYIDSGIRSGSDILKALALGVKAVFIGRPLFWGLAIGGSTGVRKVLSILKTELDEAMRYSGISSIEHVDATILSLPKHMMVPRNAAIRKIKDLALLLNQGKITKQVFQSNKAKLLQA